LPEEPAAVLEGFTEERASASARIVIAIIVVSSSSVSD